MSENPIFSYTHRDYEGSRKEGLSRIPLLSEGKWTDLNATDPGIIILDYVHAIIDMINYYQDHQALESFLSTAKERVNILRLAKQLSYKVKSAKGAICEVEFTSPVHYDHIIKIPKHHPLETTAGIPYLTSEDSYLLPGELRVFVPCEQGKLNTITYNGTGISRYSPVENAANQVLYISDSNIDIDSIEITDSLGNIWKAVDYIIFSSNTDRVYEANLEADGSIAIRFGDGVRGVVPQLSDELKISYISTLAEEGRTGAKTIRILATPVYDNGVEIEFFVDNLKASSGGSSAQSSSEIKAVAPGAIKSQDRAVVLEDYENLARLVDGVEDAKAYDINTMPDLCLYHEVKLLIKPEDPDSSVELLKKRVHEFISRRLIPPTNLQVLSPTYVPVDVEVTVKLLDSVVAERVQYEIQDAVREYFKGFSKNIGTTFYPIDLSTVISSIKGVRNIVSITPNSPVEVGALEGIKLGDSLTITTV